LKKILSSSFEILGPDRTAQLVDDIKNFGYKYATVSGLSISKEDMVIPKNKQQLLEEA